MNRRAWEVREVGERIAVVGLYVFASMNAHDRMNDTVREFVRTSPEDTLFVLFDAEHEGVPEFARMAALALDRFYLQIHTHTPRKFREQLVLSLIDRVVVFRRPEREHAWLMKTARAAGKPVEVVR